MSQIETPLCNIAVRVNGQGCGKEKVMTKRLLSLMLSLCMVLSLITVQSVTVQAYSMDYNYIDNVLAESGYVNYYDDSLEIIKSNFTKVGNYGANSLTDNPARFLFSNSLGNAVVPMTKDLFCGSSFNVQWAKAHYGLSGENADEDAKKKLEEYWASNGDKISVDAYTGNVFTYSKETVYDPTGQAYNTVNAGYTKIVCINNADLKEATLTVDGSSNISDYAFAKCSKLKKITLNIKQGTSVIFPYAFAFGCSSLKYISYPQDFESYTFGEYSFAKCTSLIHFVGTGENAATYNPDNDLLRDAVFVFENYAFSGCTSLTHINLCSKQVSLGDYAFGQAGLTYIGFYDMKHGAFNYDYMISRYKEYASLEVANKLLSDKAFDGVKAERIYVADKDIYDSFSRYADGYLFGRRLCVANVSIAFDCTDSDGGTMEDTVIRYDDDLYSLKNTLTKEGYDFGGWTNANEISLADVYNAPHNGTDWITAFLGSGTVENCYRDGTVLSPVWTPKTFKITYVLNGGNADEIELPTIHTFGVAINTLPEPVRYGYDFAGWYEDAKFTKEFSGITDNDMSEHTYYAKWKIHVNKITYKLNGGKNHPDNPSTISVEDGKVYLKDATREGFDFAGWTTGDNDEKITYIQASQGNMTLYANWKVHTNKISYVLNGGHFAEDDYLKEHTYGEAVTELPTPVRSGYDFLGWYEDAKFTKEFSGITEDDMDDHTYYAKWEIHINKITYELNGGKNDPDNPSTISAEDGKVYLKDAVREGFDFAGWTTGDNDQKVTYITAAMGDMNLIAVWKAHTNSITYELNGGQFLQEEYLKEHTYGTAITELPTPTRYGYDFLGWYENPELTKEFQGIPAIEMIDHTYYAKWKAHEYKVTYMLDGGTNHPDNPTTMSIEDGKVYLKDPTKTGNDFQYWTTGENDEKVTYIMAAQCDYTVYAIWKPHTYSITYELNGGEFFGTPETTHTYGERTYLMVPPKKDNYVFAGWYYDSQFTTRVFDIDAAVAMDVTLYAKWELAVSSLKIPEKKGYRFIGWVDKKMNPIPNTDAVSAHEGNIFANYLDIRWTTAKKKGKTYVSTLKSDYEWYKKKEERGDRESFSEYAPDGSFEIYGVADGYVTNHTVTVNIKGKVSSVELSRDGKKAKIKRNSKSDDIYLKGYSLSKSGVYQLTVTSGVAQKTITFIIDRTKPVVTAKRTKTVTVKSKLQKKVKKKSVKKKKKGHTVTTTTKKGYKKTVKKVTSSKFKVKQKRRMYIFSETETSQDKYGENVVTKTTIGASVSWKDNTAGVSTVYINGKQLSAKKVKKKSYTFKKAGTYKVEVYDYIGNHFVQTIVVDDKDDDVTLPTCNMKNGTTYVTGSTLSAKDKSGIAYIEITDWHGFKHKYNRSYYQFKNAGTYKIHIVDKSGNYRNLKIKVVRKKRY